ncbi:MAG: acyl-CoA dehydrogenase family protein [Gammaproteobacteria bacterium]
MQLTFSPAEEAFRQEVRAFLRGAVPEQAARAQRQGWIVERHLCRDLHRALYDKGWAVPEWPVQHGGTDWSAVQRFIFEDEYAEADAPYVSTAGLHLVGPVIAHFGTDAMKARYLDPIARGDLFFAQGFSEPQAGSDLAHLKTRAVRDGDHYVINGGKIWTSHAHESDMMFCLCRTDPDAKPQAGLSMILLDMHAPGVRIRPIVSLEYDHHLNEVFLDDVRVPAENLIGEENKAWSYAKFLLDNERTFNAQYGRLKRYVKKIRRMAADQEQRLGVRAMTPEFERKLTRLEIDVRAQEWAVLRVLCAATGVNHAVLGASASALKIRGSELMLRATELELELAGPHAFPRYDHPHGDRPPADLPSFAPEHAVGLFAEHVYWRASRIYSGSNEIQRGIIWNTLFRN